MSAVRHTERRFEALRQSTGDGSIVMNDHNRRISAEIGSASLLAALKRLYRKEGWRI